MSTFDDYIAATEEQQASMSKSIANIKNDITTLNLQIAELQTHQGEITPAMQSKLNTVAATGNLLAQSLADVDAIVNPVVPADTSGDPVAGDTPTA